MPGVTLGFAQQGLCTTPSYQNNIKNIHLNNSSTHMTNLILYDGDGYSCIDNEHTKSCLALRDNPVFQQNDETYRTFFKLHYHTFSLHSVALLNYSLILVLISWIPMLSCWMVTNMPSSYTLGTADSVELANLLLILFFYRVYNASGCIDEKNYITFAKNLQDVAVLCGPLEACDLRIVTITDMRQYENIFVIYKHVMYVMRIVWIVNESINLSLLLMYVCYSDCILLAKQAALVRRQEVQHMHGEELQRALEACSDEFIDLYLSDWCRIYWLPSALAQQPRHTHAATPAYSPLATSPATEVLERAYVYEIDDSIACTLCSAALFTTGQGEPHHVTHTADAGLHTRPTCAYIPPYICYTLLYPAGVHAKKVIQLPCSHAFHQVCILHWAMSPTNNRGECPACKADICELK